MSPVVDQIVGWCCKQKDQSCTIGIGKDTPFYKINKEWENRLILWSEIVSFVREELLIDQFYPDEIPIRVTIGQLADYLTAKLLPATVDPDVECISDRSKTTLSSDKIEDPTVFILGCPRSGTTLFRAMLAGHPEVNAPPELHLLGHGDTLKARERNIVDKGQTWRLFGVIQTLAHQMDMTEDEAFAYMSTLTKKDVSIKRIYELIHSTSQKSILVDKTPHYSKRIETMRRAEEMFRDPKYLFIHRHPGAVMESLGRMKGEWVWRESSNSLDVKSRLKDSEGKWLNVNRNILAFLKNVPAKRRFTVAYEDLVKDTEPTMIGVAKFLNIPFDSAMLSPYSGERLTHGLGDPNLSSRKRVDPALIDSWRSRLQDLSLDEVTVKMAVELGYDV